MKNYFSISHKIPKIEPYDGSFKMLIEFLHQKFSYEYVLDIEPKFNDCVWEGIFETTLYYLSDRSMEEFNTYFVPLYKKFPHVCFTPEFSSDVDHIDNLSKPLGNLTIPLETMKIYYYMALDEHNDLIPRELKTGIALPWLPTFSYERHNKGHQQEPLTFIWNPKVIYPMTLKNSKTYYQTIPLDGKSMFDLGYGIEFSYVKKEDYISLSLKNLNQDILNSYDEEKILSIINTSKDYYKIIYQSHEILQRMYQEYLDCIERFDENCSFNDVLSDIEKEIKQDLHQLTKRKKR